MGSTCCERREPLSFLRTDGGNEQTVLTKQNVMDLLDCSEANLKDWRRAGVFADHWIAPNYDGCHAGYAPQVVVAGELLNELKLVFGPKSSLPTEIAVQARSTIDALWQAAREGRPHGSTLEYQGPRGLKFLIPAMAFIESARLKLAGVAA